MMGSQTRECQRKGFDPSGQTPCEETLAVFACPAAPARYHAQRGAQSPGKAEGVWRCGVEMQQRKRLRWGVIIALYAVTWIGGWITYPRQFKAEAAATWATRPDTLVGRHKDGPQTSMGPPIPLLPGLLVTPSSTTIGLREGCDGLTFFVYYGCGSATLGHICIRTS